MTIIDQTKAQTQTQTARPVDMIDALAALDAGTLARIWQAITSPTIQARLSAGSLSSIELVEQNEQQTILGTSQNGIFVFIALPTLDEQGKPLADQPAAPCLSIGYATVESDPYSCVEIEIDPYAYMASIAPALALLHHADVYPQLASIKGYRI